MSISSSSIEEEAPIDLLPARRTDPVESLRRFFKFNFCEPHQPPSAAAASPPRLRSATLESHPSVASNNDENEVVSEKKENNGMEGVIKNAKSLLDNFWNKNKRTSSSDSENGALDGGKLEFHADGSNSSASARMSRAIQNKEMSTDEDQEIKRTWSVVITEPGTGRTRRVLRGLELFVITLGILFLTFLLLHRLGVHLDFVLERKQAPDL